MKKVVLIYTGRKVSKKHVPIKKAKPKANTLIEKIFPTPVFNEPVRIIPRWAMELLQDLPFHYYQRKQKEISMKTFIVTKENTQHRPFLYYLLSLLPKKY